ncbi:11438_t:CDS:2 [Entrophospora sp. SA101]|nr:11438_t:CDS:2 [Entrophospora sp. SA101]
MSVCNTEKCFLPQIFNLEPSFTYNSNISTQEHVLENQPLLQLLYNEKKGKKIEVEERTRLWFEELDQLTTKFNTYNNDQFTLNFISCTKNFWNRIVEETDFINKFNSKKRQCEEEPD